MDYRVKDIKLAGGGRLRIEWAERHMPVLMRVREEFSKGKPLSGVRIGACLHVTKETAVLVRTLKAGGAEVYLCASNPLSTQDDVAAALVEDGISVFAWRGESSDDYYWSISRVLEEKPQVMLDDGADLIATAHVKDMLDEAIGGQEETTTGVIRLKAMEKSGDLRIPVVAVNDASSKRLFDNYYGTGESSLHGVLRCTNILLPGKKVVVLGYGHCGQGIAKMARAVGAHTIVCEVDPIKALKAYYDGHEVMPSLRAAEIGDVFITATGCKDVLTREHFMRMRSGAILANAGHFNVEVSIPDLKSISRRVRKIRENVEEYELEDGRKLYLLAEGRLVNLVCGEGHPSEVMDLSFSLQALCVKYLMENRGELESRVYNVPDEVDRRVAELKLETLGVEIDKLTEEQQKYLESWKLGT